MSARVLLFDVDGVLVRHPVGRSWTSELLVDLGIDPDDLDRDFFSVHFDQVLAGGSDLLERLDAVLSRISSVSSQELVDYWFTHDAVLDERLLADLSDARDQGSALHLATTQEHHRARFLWHSLGLRNHFDAMHYAADVGAFKSESEFYRVVESRTGLAPAEHGLIDDSAENVTAARAAGWRAFLWTSQSRLSDALHRIGADADNDCHSDESASPIGETRFGPVDA